MGKKTESFCHQQESIGFGLIVDVSFDLGLGFIQTIQLSVKQI